MLQRDRGWLGAMALGLLGAGSIVALATLRGGEGDSDTAADGPLDGFEQPRTIHFAPDGRLLVTDVGTGRDDGRVVAVDLADGRQEVLLDGLPSTSWDSAIGSVSGPSGAAMAPDGIVCVVIGDGPAGEGFGELRCTDGLRVDLMTFEQQNNPAGDHVESDPFDVVYAGPATDGWYVSDAAANVVLHVERTGQITIAGIFDTDAGFDEPGGQPAGLNLWEGRLTASLLGGGVVTGTSEYSYPREFPRMKPIAATPPSQERLPAGIEGSVIFLSYSDDTLAPDTGSIQVGTAALVDGLDRPTGFVRLDDGRFVVAEQERGRLRIVDADG